MEMGDEDVGVDGEMYRFFLRGVGMEWLVFLGRF